MGERIVSAKELRNLIPYSRQHILRLENSGKFPRRIRLGPGPTGRIGWRLSAIMKWIDDREAEQQAEAGERP